MNRKITSIILFVLVLTVITNTSYSFAQSMHATDPKIQLLTPLKQVKAYVPPDYVTCKEGFQLIIKTENNSPACVYLSHVARFLAQGWEHRHMRF